MHQNLGIKVSWSHQKENLVQQLREYVLVKSHSKQIFEYQHLNKFSLLLLSKVIAGVYNKKKSGFGSSACLG